MGRIYKGPLMQIFVIPGEDCLCARLYLYYLVSPFLGHLLRLFPAGDYTYFVHLNETSEC